MASGLKNKILKVWKRWGRTKATAAVEPLSLFCIRDFPAWKEFEEANQAGIGSSIIQFAADWAALMEEKMAEGASLSEVAEKAERQAQANDGLSLSGSGYVCAISLLSKCWIHGEELLVWYNSAQMQ